MSKLQSHEGLLYSEQIQELEWRLQQMEALARELRQELNSLKKNLVEEAQSHPKLKTYQQMVDRLGKMAELT